MVQTNTPGNEALQGWADQPPPALFPTLSPQGLALWRWMRQHPHAPLFRNQSGPRLSAAAQQACRWRQAVWRHAPLPPPGLRGQQPWWLSPWLARRWPHIPAWAALGSKPLPWSDMPTTQRADLSGDLARRVWATHPRAAQEPLICFSTSGTTGHPLKVPSLPSVAADYRAFHQRALAHFGIRLRAGAGQVGAVLAGFQERCFTYASVNPLQGECGVVKLNLAVHEWRQAQDRAAYLNALAPELISGDPVSLAELAGLEMQHKPRALLSTSMALSHRLRQDLEARFACPVLDLYSMNEAGPIAVWQPAQQAWQPLQPGLFIEILDEQGHPQPEGEPGEITLTGGFNPLLPLLRYRTGDHARWVHRPSGWMLVDLQGRSPVRFACTSGRWLNNIELTHLLQRHPLRRWALHQAATGALHLRLDPWPADAERVQIATELQQLLGLWPLHITQLNTDDKVRQHTRDEP
ncbi:MAG: AMP-binding protein [Ideonella sp.]|nr:AMP-binding protein [Ideonella sp.]